MAINHNSLSVIFVGSTEAAITNVAIGGCDGKPICPLPHNKNVTFEVDFTPSKIMYPNPLLCRIQLSIVKMFNNCEKGLFPTFLPAMNL